MFVIPLGQGLCAARRIRAYDCLEFFPPRTRSQNFPARQLAALPTPRALLQATIKVLPILSS
jgi:hypothetical protein